jgi:penicillin-binding protein 2
MMMYLRDDRRPPASPQFTLRVAILSGIALICFSVIFLRLWYLQVLSGDKYLEQAQNNQIRQIKVQAPRGEILDRNGKVLVENRTSLALQVEPQRLPRERSERAAVIERLGSVIGASPERIEREIRRQTKELPASPVTLKRDVPYPLVYYLQERQAEFPGVTVQRVFVRTYPEGTLAAHLFGYVGEVSEEQLKEPQYRQLEPGDLIGQTGVESAYDSMVRGEPGAIRVQVDAQGRPRGGQLSAVEARAGNNLRLSIDSDVQAAGEAAISSFSLPSAFAVMDIHTGEVLGLGSYPTFDPAIFTRPNVPSSVFEGVGDQFANRATQGLYPTGSSWKPITAVAALEEGLITPDTSIYDGGSITVGGIEFSNAGGAAFGSISLPSALQVSSDVFFYNLGLDADATGEDPIQRWAHDLGIGEPTGIDVPGEVEGLVPTPEWRNELYREGETDRPWSAGDAVNLAVGQGDLQTNPLQMAVAYAAIANGGEVLRPHVAQRVEDPSGRVVQEIRPAPRRHVEIDPGHRRAILAGLNAAAMQPGGTSYAVFGNFPVEIAGKTGTAERPPYVDQSWYVALAPYPDPEVVVAVTIEQGGFGAEAAAPAARQILSSYLEVKPGKAGGAPADTSIAGAYD